MRNAMLVSCSKSVMLICSVMTPPPPFSNRGLPSKTELDEPEFGARQEWQRHSLYYQSSEMNDKIAKRMNECIKTNETE